ncbi:MAG: sigma-70 family RNA polymerase sigma factor [Planctomycetota bacterium]
MLTSFGMVCFLVSIVVFDFSTSISLLLRLQDSGNSSLEEDWNEFVSIYAPMIYQWSVQRGLQEADASDLSQDVLIKLYRNVPKLNVDPDRRFRGYLAEATRNSVINLARARKRRGERSLELEKFVDRLEVQPDLIPEDEEYCCGLYRRALQVMKSELSEQKWKICVGLFVDGKNADEIASELGVKKNFVYTTKSRVTKRLRERLKWLDS